MTTSPQPTIPQFTMADRFRKAREHACLGQDDLAERMQVTRQTISNYERGNTTRPRRIIVNGWALATGVPVEWLWTGQAPDTPSDQALTRSGWNADVIELRAA